MAIDIEISRELISDIITRFLDGKMDKKIEQLISKVDGIIIRDLRSANEQLVNCLKAKDYESLYDIRQSYIKNIGLPLNESTSGIPNTTIVALSYLGLVIINSTVKAHNHLTKIYILRMFTTGENFVRTVCFPDIYREYFLPKCSEIIRKYENEINNIATMEDWSYAAWIRVQQGACICASVTGLVKGAHVFATSMENEIPKKSFFKTKNGLIQEREREIDKYCAKIAQRFIIAIR